MAEDASQAGAWSEEVDLLNEKDLYKILGVARGAKQEEIRKAYKKLSLRHHPDKNLDDPDAKLKFQHIAEAFSVLSDDKKRLKYDKSGDMDLEDFDMDHFMNMWVGEMMEEGGMVDDMMKEVLPWVDERDKMKQFMEEKVSQKGSKFVCQICKVSASTKRLMTAHFEQKHVFECEDWAKETIKSMKASFESFMKQVTGIGDSSGTFVLPDGKVANMSQVKGLPNIREHMQKQVDKAKELELVSALYRKVAGSGEEEGEKSKDGGKVEAAVETKEIVAALGVSEEEAEELRRDQGKLLRKLRKKIERLNEEEEEAEMMAMLGQDMPPAFSELLGGLGGLPAELGGLLGGLPPGMGGLLGGLPPGMGGLLGGRGAPPFPFGADGLDDLEDILEAMGMEDPSNVDAMLAQLQGRGLPGASRRAGGPAANGIRGTAPSEELSCKCGYSCGTRSALDKHLASFKGSKAHEARIVPAMPSRMGGYAGAMGRGVPVAPAGVVDDDIELGCVCGYSCGTEKALQKHLDRFPGSADHKRK